MPALALTLAVALTLHLASDSARAEEQTPATPTTPPPVKKPFYLIVDYLSPALFAGEPFTACLRVENTTAAADVTVRADCFDAGGKKLRGDDTKLNAPANGFADYKKELDLRGVARVAFTLVTPQGGVAGPEVAFVRESDAWPAAALVEGRLTDNARVLVPLVERVEREANRTFAPIKWALGIKDQDEKAPVTRALLLLPGAWAAPAPAPVGRASGPDRTHEAPASVAVDFGALLPSKAKAAGALGPYEPAGSGCPPVLRAFNEILRAVSAQKETPERVVIVLPPEDLEVATSSRVYRIALEGLLGRLERLGVKQAVLAGPFKFGVPEARLEVLRAEVREAARAHGARVLDLGEAQDETSWRLEPEKSGVYGRRPNAEGQKRIAQKLEDLLP